MEDGDELYEYLYRLPKVELHAHLNGCIREETLFELAAERGVTLPKAYFAPAQSKSHKQHRLLYNTSPRSLTDCFAMFAEIPKAVNDLVALRRIVKEALQDFATHSVVYLELRSTPKRLWRDFRQAASNNNRDDNLATKQEYIDTIVKVMIEFEAEEAARYATEMQAKESSVAFAKIHAMLIRPPLKCRFLVSVDRSQSLEEAIEHVDLAIAMKQQNSMVVGMDLGGNPTKQDFALFQEEFDRARQAGLFLTLHCAEVPCDPKAQPKSHQEAQSILDFGPDRLGHALLLPADLQQALLERKIPVETCPTSNVMTLELTRHSNGTHLTLLEGLSQHRNLAEWIQANHPLTVATDDPGVFGTTLTKELWLVARTFDLPKEYFQELAIRSLEIAFCDNVTKETVTSTVNNFLAWYTPN